MSKVQYLLNYTARRSRTQSEPLLSDNVSPQYGTVPEAQAPARRTIGFWSAVFIISNSMIGTGVFATPATVLTLSGSVGFSLSLWLLGSLYAVTGLQVYVVWGCAFPKSGAEKNYLQYLFPRPPHLILCLYAATIALLASAAGSSLVFGEYFLKALLAREPSAFLLQLTSFLCVTTTLLLHGTVLEVGLRVQNVLGIFQLLVLAIVIATGLVALRTGIPPATGPEANLPPWRGRDNFIDIWRGTILSPSSICLALNSVIWSFTGFQNANYAMGEMKNPRRAITVAGPLAVAIVATLYMFTNVSYLLGASKEEIITSGRLIVGLLVKNVWGTGVERLVNLGVALSTLGSVLAMSFAQGRINQELAKEGVLPFSELLASSKPFNAPLSALGLNWILCVLTIFFVPSGDMYNLVINLGVFPTSVVNATISFGLIYLFLAPSSRSDGHKQYGWHLLSPGTLVATIIFGTTNVFLFIAPFVPPPPGSEPYQRLPYWTHGAVGCALFGLGAIWWLFRPQKLDYRP